MEPSESVVLAVSKWISGEDKDYTQLEATCFSSYSTVDGCIKETYRLVDFRETNADMYDHDELYKEPYAFAEDLRKVIMESFKGYKDLKVRIVSDVIYIKYFLK